jgi:hypothetical protein
MRVFLDIKLSMSGLTGKQMGRNLVKVEAIPLSYYRNHSCYILLTLSLDHIGTPLTYRFTRNAIAAILDGVGLDDVHSSVRAPNWCFVGIKR